MVAIALSIVIWNVSLLLLGRSLKAFGGNLFDSSGNRIMAFDSVEYYCCCWLLVYFE